MMLAILSLPFNPVKSNLDSVTPFFHGGEQTYCKLTRQEGLDFRCQMKSINKPETRSSFTEVYSIRRMNRINFYSPAA